MDWILSDKSNEETLIDDYQDLMQQRYTVFSKGGKINKLAAFAAKSDLSLVHMSGNEIESSILNKEGKVDEMLRKLQKKFG